MTRPGLGSSTAVPRFDAAGPAGAALAVDPAAASPEDPRAAQPDDEQGQAPPASGPAPKHVYEPARVAANERDRSDEASVTGPLPPRSGPSDRASVAFWQPEAATGTRRRDRAARPFVSVEDVGDAAVEIANAPRRSTPPKLTVAHGEISKAPIDTRAAFVMSLVDGRNTVDAIVDMSGMRAEEVDTVLTRLARLGLIALA